MQSYSRAESIKAGRGHETWQGLYPVAGSLSGDYESCLNVRHPRSGPRPLLMMGSGWFKDFLEQSKVQQPQFQFQPSLLHFLTDFE